MLIYTMVYTKYGITQKFQNPIAHTGNRTHNSRLSRTAYCHIDCVFHENDVSNSLLVTLQLVRHWHWAFLCQAVSHWESQGETCSDININGIYHTIWHVIYHDIHVIYTIPCMVYTISMYYIISWYIAWYVTWYITLDI